MRFFVKTNAPVPSSGRPAPLAARLRNAARIYYRQGRRRSPTPSRRRSMSSWKKDLCLFLRGFFHSSRSVRRWSDRFPWATSERANRENAQNCRCVARFGRSILLCQCSQSPVATVAITTLASPCSRLSIVRTGWRDFLLHQSLNSMSTLCNDTQEDNKVATRFQRQRQTRCEG